MKILFDDLIQHEDKNYFTSYSSPQLFETLTFDAPIRLEFDNPVTIDCIGIGNCNSSFFSLSTIAGYSYRHNFDESNIVLRNGLYLIPKAALPLDPDINKYTLYITFEPGSTIGRIAAGRYSQLNTVEQKELGFTTSKKPIRSQSGSILPSISGYAARVIQLTCPYEINTEVYKQMYNAYARQLANSFPLFIVFDESETHKFTLSSLKRFYGVMDNNFMLQSRAREFLYSYSFKFTEAF